MIYRIVTIVWKDVFTHFRQWRVSVLTLGTPLVLALILFFSFENFFANANIPLQEIPIGIVNQDQGSKLGYFCDAIVYALMPEDSQIVSREENPFYTLFDAQLIESEFEAKQMVDRGELVGVMIIPEKFSQRLVSDGASLELYLNRGSRIGGMIFENAVQSIATGTRMSRTSVEVTANGLVTSARLRSKLTAGLLDEYLEQVAIDTVKIETRPVYLELVGISGFEPAFDFLRHYTIGLAIFFSGLAAQISATGILQELRKRTLQRLLVTPVTSFSILAGKFSGAFIIGLIQMFVLMAALSGMATQARGETIPIWGTDAVGVVSLTLVLVAAATGFGLVIGGIAKSYEQATFYGTSILILMGLLSGVLVPLDIFPTPIQVIARTTYFYWGMDGFLRLVNGETVIHIYRHMLILLGMVVGSVLVSVMLIKRRMIVTNV